MPPIGSNGSPGVGRQSANIVFDDCDLAGRGRDRPSVSSTTPVGIAVPAAGSWCSAGFRQVHGLFEPAVKGVVVGDPADRDTEMGPLVSRPHLGVGGRLRARRRPRRLPRVGAQRSRILVPADGVHPGRAVTGPPPRRSSAGCHGAALRGRGRRDRTGQPHRLRPVRIDLDRQPVRALRVSRAIESGNLSVNSHSRFVTAPVRRLQAVRPGPRTGPGRSRALHRNQERLLCDGEKAKWHQSISPSAWPAGWR